MSKVTTRPWIMALRERQKLKQEQWTVNSVYHIDIDSNCSFDILLKHVSWEGREIGENEP